MQGWTAWNITADPDHGIGKWSVSDLTAYMRDGYAPGRAVASGPMKEAVDYSLSQLTNEDRRAIAVYLRTVEPVKRGPVPQTQPQTRADARNRGAGERPWRTHLRRCMRELPWIGWSGAADAGRVGCSAGAPWRIRTAATWYRRCWSGFGPLAAWRGVHAVVWNRVLQ